MKRPFSLKTASPVLGLVDNKLKWVHNRRGVAVGTPAPSFNAYGSLSAKLGHSTSKSSTGE